MTPRRRFIDDIDDGLFTPVGVFLTTMTLMLAALATFGP